MAKERIESLPKHIGIIMDGNGRWAKKRGLPRKFGHRQGAKAFRKVVRYCKEKGIRCCTFYAFSTENWSRPKEEVDAIMSLMKEYLDEVRKYIDEDVRVIFIGDRTKLDHDIQQKMNALEEDSKDFTSMTLGIAVNYGGRAEITNAAKSIAQEVASGDLDLSMVDEHTFSQHLYTSQMPDVDLIIRPSGEYRISNFLLWQSAYAEFIFMKNILWPDFSEKDMDKALDEFARRNRRFGGV
ncbi:MAG: isoprenyl transferase [Clostridiales bacterium]|nr:isoprenyl transferase [Clostridiales bacterium]